MHHCLLLLFPPSSSSSYLYSFLLASSSFVSTRRMISRFLKKMQRFPLTPLPGYPGYLLRFFFVLVFLSFGSRSLLMIFAYYFATTMPTSFLRPRYDSLSLRVSISVSTIYLATTIRPFHDQRISLLLLFFLAWALSLSSIMPRCSSIGNPPPSVSSYRISRILQKNDT